MEKKFCLQESSHLSLPRWQQLLWQGGDDSAPKLQELPCRIWTFRKVKETWTGHLLLVCRGQKENAPYEEKQYSEKGQSIASVFVLMLPGTMCLRIEVRHYECLGWVSQCFHYLESHFRVLFFYLSLKALLSRECGASTQGPGAETVLVSCCFPLVCF